MEKVVVDKRKICAENYKFGDGSEGSVYLYNDDEVIKILNTGRSHILKNKLKKIKILLNERINGFVFPKAIAVDKFDDFIGYIMERVNTDYIVESLNDIHAYDRIVKSLDGVPGCNLESRKYPLSLKIDYLIKLEHMLKELSDRDIYNTDIKGDNILVDINGDLYNIDTDNYAVGHYGVDCYSAYLLHYQNNVCMKIDANTVKYILGIFTLEFLTDENISIYDRIMFDLRSDYNCLSELVNLLDIGNEEKDVFIELFSDTKKKQCLGQVLLNLSTSEETFIRLKK